MAGTRTAVLVLGSGSNVAEDWDGNTVALPNQSSAERVVEATRVYRLVNPDWIVVSGGRVYEDDPSSASAESARDLLVSLGVPAAKVLVENTSKTTHEEAVTVGAKLKSMAVERVVLVTSDLHMPRALGAFRAQGIKAVPAVARRQQDRTPWNLDLLPSDSGLGEAGSVAREILGIGHYALRGWYQFP